MNTDNINPNYSLNKLLNQLDNNPSKADGKQASAGEVLGSFGDILKNHMNEVNTLQHNAEEAAKTYATGGSVELHQVMIATERAEMSLELTMQIRNKLIQAYQEISHMSV